MRKPQAGFTIVELLIVIVVIAILATISIVAYNGIQTRASNTAIISAAQQTIKLVKAYNAAYAKYPVAGGAYCLTTDNQCVSYNGTALVNDNATMLTELKKIGQPVDSLPRASNGWYGIYWDYYPTRTYNHKNVPVLIMYNLKGESQDCKLDNVVVADPSPLPGEPNPFITSQIGYTGGAGTGITKCWVSVDI